MTKGQRVRMVQTKSTGVVVNDKAPAGADGGDRVSVRWDRTGTVTDWHPDFLRPAESDPAADPDEVVSGNVGRRRGRVYVDKRGITLMVPDGMFAVPTALQKESK